MILPVPTPPEEDAWREMAFQNRMRDEAAEAEAERLRGDLENETQARRYMQSNAERWQTEANRAHGLLAECAAAIKSSERGWLRDDLLRAVWGYLRAQGVPIPGDPPLAPANTGEQP